jgi:hypothetical protein
MRALATARAGTVSFAPVEASAPLPQDFDLHVPTFA